jgi:hypothetical protein
MHCQHHDIDTDGGNYTAGAINSLLAVTNPWRRTPCAYTTAHASMHAAMLALVQQLLQWLARTRECHVHSVRYANGMQRRRQWHGSTRAPTHESAMPLTCMPAPFGFACQYLAAECRVQYSLRRKVSGQASGWLRTWNGDGPGNLSCL